MEQLLFRPATENDLNSLIDMLADDELGQQRENNARPLPDCYQRAFLAIDKDPNNHLIVVERAGEIAGMLQLTYIPYLTHQGGWRGLIEGVRIARHYRGQGLGQKMFAWAIEHAKQRGCHMLQLTSDKQRPRAIDFYKKLGFIDSHEGMKLHLPL